MASSDLHSRRRECLRGVEVTNRRIMLWGMCRNYAAVYCAMFAVALDKHRISEVLRSPSIIESAIDAYFQSHMNSYLTFLVQCMTARTRKPASVVCALGMVTYATKGTMRRIRGALFFRHVASQC